MSREAFDLVAAQRGRQRRRARRGGSGGYHGGQAHGRADSALPPARARRSPGGGSAGAGAARGAGPRDGEGDGAHRRRDGGADRGSVACLTVYDMVKAVDREMSDRGRPVGEQDGRNRGDWHRTVIGTASHNERGDTWRDPTITASRSAMTAERILLRGGRCCWLAAVASARWAAGTRRVRAVGAITPRVTDLVSPAAWEGSAISSRPSKGEPSCQAPARARQRHYRELGQLPDPGGPRGGHL